MGHISGPHCTYTNGQPIQCKTLELEVFYDRRNAQNKVRSNLKSCHGCKLPPLCKVKLGSGIGISRFVTAADIRIHEQATGSVV